MDKIIKEKLQSLEPISLEIIDETHMHVGHSGNDGGMHFEIRIKSTKFNGKNLINRHRLIYQLLGDLIPKKIHALKIKAEAENE